MADTFRKRIDLNGAWTFERPFFKPEEITVPSSYKPVGEALFTKTVFLAKPPGSRIKLCFEGIAFQGAVKINETELNGIMDPYVPGIYDITDQVSEGETKISVAVKDLNASYGPSEGWENYGGIVREVYIEYVNETYISDVFWRTEFCGGDSLTHRVTVLVNVKGSRLSEASVRMTLSPDVNGFGSVEAFPLQNNDAEDEYCFEALTDANHPALWSPESPNLYKLAVTLTVGGKAVDGIAREVGFRSFEARGGKFYLNGEPCFLKGVCRHDTWGEQGFTMTDGQIETDMRLIKAMGANFVRLVHYPHDRRVVQAASRIGLMVSEEPGLWWSDMGKEAVTKGALNVMKRIITRDRSEPSVVMWLAFNECDFTEEYLRDTETLCRRLDPSRPISGANCMNVKTTKELFDRCGWDFYTYHPYGPLPEQVTAGINGEGSPSLSSVADYLSGKPLVFTEWGGWYVHDNPALYKLFCLEMRKLAREGKLAGMCYWEWADMYETNRPAPACKDGILVEGLVDIHRNKRMNYFTQAEIYAEFDLPDTDPGFEMKAENDFFAQEIKIAAVINIYLNETESEISENFFAALQKAKEAALLRGKKWRRLITGPVVPQYVNDLNGLPTELKSMPPLVVRTGAKTVAIPVNAHGKNIYFIGQKSFSECYPIAGEVNDPVAEYVLRYADGASETIILRNGREISSVFATYGPSRTDPRASETRECLSFSYDKNWEDYRIAVLKAELRDCELLSVTLNLLDERFAVLLYGITVAG
ncbi:MAG: hypothetical protein FWE82_10195 [Defluviitaleaceae bacterium]|nr:hypothetical protein [Defluviitaleaceae bacterium]